MANSLAQNTKNVILKRKIGQDIYELLPKTQASQIVVSYGECTDLAEALSSIFTDVGKWNTFISGVDFAGEDAALDTLRELIDILSGDETGTAAILNRLSGIETRLTAVDADNTGALAVMDGRLDSLETRMSAVDTAVTGRLALVEADVTSIGNRVTALENAASYIYCGAALPQGVTLTERDLWIEVIEPAQQGGGGGE